MLSLEVPTDRSSPLFDNPMSLLMRSAVAAGVAPARAEVERILGNRSRRLLRSGEGTAPDPNAWAALREAFPIDIWGMLPSGPEMLITYARDQYVGEFGFAVPWAEGIATVSELGPVVEVFAGHGLWSHFLGFLTDTLATDDHSMMPGDASFVTVSVMDAEDAVREYPGRAVLMCWPPADASAERSAAAVERGGILIHVGERGGCTGTAELDRLLAEDFDLIRSDPAPGWPMLRERMDILRRK